MKSKYQEAKRPLSGKWKNVRAALRMTGSVEGGRAKKVDAELAEESSGTANEGLFRGMFML